MRSKYNIPALFGIILIILSGAFSACARPAENAGTAPTEITDQLGRAVILEGVPQRIVSLAPSNTEILFALGLADRVVAVTDYCNYPPEAEEKPSIGGFSTPNIEEIVALSPDLLLATSIHESRIIPQLEGKGLTVLALNPQTIEAVLEAITLAGRAVGVEENASALVADMQQRIEAVTGKTGGLTAEQRPKTFYVVWHDPLMTAGSGTLQDELIEKAGGTNIAGELVRYADVGLEIVIGADPGVIIVGVGHGAGQDKSYRYVLDEPRMAETRARRNDRVYTIDSDLASRPGPRIVEAQEQFAALIHPDLFK